jgi:hypothetical protein
MSNVNEVEPTSNIEDLSLTTDEVDSLHAATLSASSVERKTAQLLKRDSLFVKLSFKSICQIIPDPASRVVLVAKAFMDMERSNECVLGKKVWDCAGVINRDQRRRVLTKLRKPNPQIQITDRQGRSSVLIVV